MRRLFVVAFAALATFLTACGHPPAAHVSASPPPISLAPPITIVATTTTTTTISPAQALLAARAAVDSAVRYAAGAVDRKAPHAVGAGATPAALPIVGDYHSWPDWPLWRAVGLCEQRGNGRYDTHGDGIAWAGSPAGGLPGSAYPGGLGLSRDFWRQFAPQAGVTVTNGAFASPGEQIRVARIGSHNGTRMRGWSSWPSCIRRYWNG